MPAPHIVFAWEIGSGFGHLMPIAALGQALVHRELRVTAVIPAAAAAASLLQRAGIQTQEMPAIKAPARTFSLSANYSANLLRNGFWHQETVTQRIQAQHQLLQQLRPDLLIADHAPATLLASRDLSCPRAVMGSGFTLPPAGTPMPGVQPWFPLPAHSLAEADSALLSSVNPALQAAGLEPLAQVATLFDDLQRFLYIEAELDHYAVREHEQYWGNIEPAQTLASPPPLQGPLVFVYLSAGNRYLETVMQALRTRSDVQVLAYIAGQAAPSVTAAHIHYLAAPVDLRAIAAQCVLAITHGGTATASLMLRLGIRLLCCPQDLEKAVFARRLEERDLAHTANWFSPHTAPVAERVTQLLDDTARPSGLDGFVSRYRQRPGAETAHMIAARCCELLNCPA